MALKTCSGLIFNGGVQFRKEIRKISRHCPRSVDDAKLDHFTLLFCRGRQRNVQIYNASTQPLFCSLNLLFGDVLVDAVVVVCLSSFMIDQVELVAGSLGKPGIVKEMTSHPRANFYRELYFCYLQKAMTNRFRDVNSNQPKTSGCDSLCLLTTCIDSKNIFPERPAGMNMKCILNRHKGFNGGIRSSFL